MTGKKSVRPGWVSTVVLLSLALAPAYGQAPVFTKVLKKVNGVPVASPPAALANGDLLDWVMTYRFDPPPGQSAQTSIQDLLPPTLQYVPGSLQAPPSWTRQWYNGTSWVTTEPGGRPGRRRQYQPNALGCRPD
jgi:hypothetical protein